MRIIATVMGVAYLILLTVALLSPDPAALMRLEDFDRILAHDFIIHFSAFAVLAILIYALRWPKPTCWAPLVFLVAYGIATESLQYFVPGRAIGLLDYVANVLGITVGSLLYGLLLRRSQRSGKKKNEPSIYEST